MKMKRAISLLMAGMMTATMLTGCGDASSFTEIFSEKDGKEKVTVALWGNQILENYTQYSGTLYI